MERHQGSHLAGRLTAHSPLAFHRGPRPEAAVGAPGSQELHSPLQGLRSALALLHDAHALVRPYHSLPVLAEGPR